MDANQNQGKRVNYMNKDGQTVDPSTGRIISNKDKRGHLPLKDFKMESILKDKLINEQLSSVEFVQDYLQLHFDGRTITSYIWPIINIKNESLIFGDVLYRNALCDFIGNKVKDIFLKIKNI